MQKIENNDTKTTKKSENHNFPSQSDNFFILFKQFYHIHESLNILINVNIKDSVKLFLD